MIRGFLTSDAEFNATVDDRANVDCSAAYPIKLEVSRTTRNTIQFLIT